MASSTSYSSSSLSAPWGPSSSSTISTLGDIPSTLAQDPIPGGDQLPVLAASRLRYQQE